MIGILTEERHRRIAEEFFQLFKTPWEFVIPGKYYDVVLTTTDIRERLNTSLLIVYSSKALDVDSYEQINLRENKKQRVLSFENECIPLYKESAILISSRSSIAFYLDSEDVAALKIIENERTIFRLGYDLLDEVGYLLVQGQPADMASYPTLDAHINLLRQLIFSGNSPLLEIPPMPPGFSFIAALTHDVDFAGIRFHGCDHSMKGFLYRANLGSLRRWLTGRLSLKNMLNNWLTVLSLPFVMAGWKKDFWMQFDKYIQVERPFKSTFFIIPYKNRSGHHVSMLHRGRRATKYDVEDIQDIIKKLLAAGKEVALHGIDAWDDPIAAIDEKRRIESFSLKELKGVRMHWLCFSKESANFLEGAGFEYDSTIGYNETIGFRTGTLQVFQPMECQRLLELPLHIQDTAMFYPDFQDWKNKVAWRQCRKIFDQAEKYGGVVTLLWHERSLGPERHWGRFYDRLLRELKKRKAWITSASEIVTWFQSRRQIIFKAIRQNENGFIVKLERLDPKSPLSFIVRLHPGNDNRFIDVAWSHEPEINIPFPPKNYKERNTPALI